MRGRDRAVQNRPCIGGLVPPHMDIYPEFQNTNICGNVIKAWSSSSHVTSPRPEVCAFIREGKNRMETETEDSPQK